MAYTSVHTAQISTERLACRRLIAHSSGFFWHTLTHRDTCTEVCTTLKKNHMLQGAVVTKKSSMKVNSQPTRISKLLLLLLFDKLKSYTVRLQWRIQDFPQGGGAPTPKNAIIFQFFAENCMKMKEFEPPGGARPWRPPLDPPMVYRLLDFIHKFCLKIITST